MVTEKQMNDVLTKFYRDFTDDVDSFQDVYHDLEDTDRMNLTEGYMIGVAYGLELAESAFLRCYREACRTKKY